MEDGVMAGKSTVVIDPGKLDRSPTGTGCSARMATLVARGQLSVGDAFIGYSILDSRFDCKVESLTDINGIPAIIPSLQGRAWICGKSEVMRHPDDPWQQGYRLSDTWPKMPKG
jgi:proline racemase